MKRIKFLVKSEGSEAALGLSYDTDRGRLTAGGPYKHRDELSEWLYAAFRLAGVEWDESGSRVKTLVSLTPTDWRVGLERLGEAGFIIERVKGFRRLMN